MQKEENKAVIGDNEILETEMSEEQKYLANQITDLRNKKSKIQFDLDQIQAALTVFENTFIASTKEKADEVLEEKEEK
jgi:cell division septum initiation protein DivIVA|tara:strand:+ start:102 stop:335 length:234 start_codon:yes stop_codon:yes gene_type:complete